MKGLKTDFVNRNLIIFYGISTLYFFQYLSFKHILNKI